MNDWFLWLLLVIATERTVELVINSKIFEPLRHIIKKWAYPDTPPLDNIWQHLRIMVDYLFNCGYCMSVWVGAFYATVAPLLIDNMFMNYLVSALFLHGGSNLYHVLYEYIRRGRVKTYDISLNLQISEEREE